MNLGVATRCRYLSRDLVFPQLSPEGKAEPWLSRQFEKSFEVVRRLKSGGMGELFELEHKRLGRRCVLKALHTKHRSRHDLAARLENEARVLSSFSSPRMPAVYDSGTLEDGRPYYIMERLLGEDLCASRGVSRENAVRIVSELLLALELVHGAGFVHRDIKPDNVFLTTQGRVVLLDFGLARRTRDELRMTRLGLTLGSPRSMAPERHGDGGGDERSDLYAVGLVLYELLAGCGPFDDVGASVAALRAAHERRLPKPVSERLLIELPSRLEQVLQQALAKNPNDRFASAREMREALLNASSSLVYDEPTFVEPDRSSLAHDGLVLDELPGSFAFETQWAANSTG